MKTTLTVILSSGALAGALVLCGCSKSANPSSSAESGGAAGSTNAAVASDTPVDMAIKWTTGRKYPMHMDLEQTSKTEVPDQPQPVGQDLKLSQDFSISALKKLDNGGQQLELTFENETMNIFQGDRKVLSFDSTQDPAQDTNNPVAPILRAMVGAHIDYFTGPNGEYQRMEGLDELRNRVQVNAKQQQDRALFDSMFNEDTLKQYCSFADSMPGHPVKVGDNWRVKKDIPSRIGVLSVDLKYTFKDWQPFNQHNCAHVEVSGDISSKSISAEAGAEVEIEKGKISGQFWYDPALGMIVSANNNMDMSLKITTRAQTMTSQFSQNSRVALLE